MKPVEYGKDNSETIMLLHGGGLSWWNYREEAGLLKAKYHVVLPVLDGHADSDTPFTSIEQNARKLIDYIDENFHGAVLAIGGLSLGGQILTEMLCQRGDICKYAVIESALVVPMKTTAAMIGPAVDVSYGLIEKKWFSLLQFQSLKMPETLFEDYYRDTCNIKKQDMIRFLQANSSYTAKPALAEVKACTVILVGEREQKVMRRSAEILHAAMPGSKLQILKQCYHGESSLKQPENYVKLLLRMISDEE